ncbi:SMI1/KNR4 family protein [Actinomadura alba]|uniref:SMI1/KNR4 family protein n=1 Tax=Actinomadura alba TaxID=406431 RepID=A0ABR7LYQ1_9ACTN|nr:SMI1/KNR4 family protein [Actinomadura alba]MBC6469679.1 SMI1/KNR4 family protein [Actinomadura alba]
MDALETLRRLMPPTCESGTSVDWARLSESWGKEFPDDYRQFIEMYGAGTIENFLVVVKPGPKGESPEQETGVMFNETATAEYLWTDARRSPELADVAPELIAWGGDESADLLCWDASDDDPGRWPVLVYNRGKALWSRYDCGMVEFLVRILRADFDERPLSDLSLWGKESATFLTSSEEERRLKAGLDPWTGEPDSYAGMYGD